MVEFPDGITTIGNYAFQNCGSLLSVTIPEGVTVIGNNAFHNCSNLSSITIPESVTTLKQYAFGFCLKLSEINYNAKAAKDLTSESRVFWRAGTGITRGGIIVIFGAGVEKIPAYLFYADTDDSRYYPNVMSVTIPYSVTSIGKYAFDKCTGLVNVYYRSTKAAWDRININNNNQPLKNADLSYISVCDLTGDGVINNADLTMLLRHVAKISIIEDRSWLKTADFDYSGTVDANDVTILAQHLKK